MNFNDLSTGDAILEEIGRRIARRRIELGMTQAALAEQAGIGKRTLERLESGNSVQLANFLQVLRTLELLDGLEVLVPDAGPSPMALLKQQGRQRERASSRQHKNVPAGQPWRWGDES